MLDMHRKVLTRRELAKVLGNCARKARNSHRAKTNYFMARLALATGMRAGELCSIRCKDLTLNGDRPCIHIRAELSKSGRQRFIPLWWDDFALEMIKEEVKGRGPEEFVMQTKHGDPLTIYKTYRRWKNMLNVLPADRQRHLTFHSLRHTFCSHALYAGIPILSVRDAAGHKSVEMTNKYLHVVVDSEQDDKKQIFDWLLDDHENQIRRKEDLGHICPHCKALKREIMVLKGRIICE